ncbi:MAG: serine dehydratase subunit alpha family protein, partial [Peptostreptococcaceae bacterium]
MCVGIPGTERLGMKVAAAMGFVGGHSENGLRVLETLDEEQVKIAEKYMDNSPISISPADTKEKVFIEVALEGKNHTSKAVIRTKHDNFVYLEKDGEILLNEDQQIEESTPTVVTENVLNDITIKELVENVEAMEFKDIEFLLEGIAMNQEMANYGLNQKVGIGVGYGMKKSMEIGLMGDDLLNNAMMITAAASDARMAGVKLPVMI